MSRKENLKKRVDELCKELGITEPQYSDKTTEPQLNKVIDELEAKLPDMDESDDEAQSQTPENDANHIAGDQSEQTESETSEKSEVLIGAAVELPDDATVLDDGEPPEVNADENGNVQVLVDKPFQCLQGQETMLLKRGDKPFLDEETAMEAVDAGLAYFVAQY